MPRAITRFSYNLLQKKGWLKNAGFENKIFICEYRILTIRPPLFLSFTQLYKDS